MSTKKLRSSAVVLKGQSSYLLVGRFEDQPVRLRVRDDERRCRAVCRGLSLCWGLIFDDPGPWVEPIRDRVQARIVEKVEYLEVLEFALRRVVSCDWFDN